MSAVVQPMPTVITEEKQEPDVISLLLAWGVIEPASHYGIAEAMRCALGMEDQSLERASIEEIRQIVSRSMAPDEKLSDLIVQMREE